MPLPLGLHRRRGRDGSVPYSGGEPCSHGRWPDVGPWPDVLTSRPEALCFGTALFTGEAGTMPSPLGLHRRRGWDGSVPYSGGEPCSHGRWSDVGPSSTCSPPGRKRS